MSRFGEPQVLDGHFARGATPMGRLGVPELLVILMISSVWLVPIAAGIWALVTLHRVRVGQDEVRAKLELIERLLQRA
jgi:hypothetical protein